MNEFEAPKSFWKYYDLYRRKLLSLSEYSILSCISEKDLKMLLWALSFSQKGDEKK